MSLQKAPGKAFVWASTSCLSRTGLYSAQRHRRLYHASRRQHIVKPFLLADVGEGITECQIIQWYVQPGARVEEFDKLCEVQSDKASLDITSPFAGVVKKLHYEPDAMAITGKPLVDIDAEDDSGQPSSTPASGEVAAESSASEIAAEAGQIAAQTETVKPIVPDIQSSASKSSHAKSMATPAVRHLVKELQVSIEDVEGTGRDGRVLREDVLNYAQQRNTSSKLVQSTKVDSERTALTPIQRQMFKAMSKSLSIPHFLYTCSTDMSEITNLRRMLDKDGSVKVTAFAYILKAVSLAFKQHKLMNASLDLSDSNKPALIFKSSHDFGIAVDTPSGLVVPVIRGVQDLSIEAIAIKIREVSKKARESQLGPADFNGASFTLSNIGAVGGGVVSPVISEPQVAIVGIGRSRIVPAFAADGQLCKREELVLSWSADHRVVDGAECARCAERVRSLLESPASMLSSMR